MYTVEFLCCEIQQTRGVRNVVDYIRFSGFAPNFSVLNHYLVYNLLHVDITIFLRYYINVLPSRAWYSFHNKNNHKYIQILSQTINILEKKAHLIFSRNCHKPHFKK